MNWRQEAVDAYERGDRRGAIDAFVLALEDGAPKDVARDLAIVHCELGQFVDAIAVLEPYLAEYPDDGMAWCALSNALLEQNRSADALQAARSAIASSPESWHALLALANAQIDLGNFDVALAALIDANRLAPHQPEPLVNQSALFARTRRPAEALSAAKRAIRIAPQDVAAHLNFAIAYLLRGDYASGFAEYEWRRHDPSGAEIYTRPSIPLWNGEPLPAGTLFVGMEQGMGDFICFSRLLRDARQRVARIVCEVPEPLAALYADFDGIDAICKQGEPISDRIDAFAPIASLPHLLQFSPQQAAPSATYLHADPALVASYAKRFAEFGKRRSIGIVWSGNPAYRMDRHRSLPISALEELAGVEDVAWISLQKGSTEAAVDALSFPIYRFGESLSSFVDTAAAIEALDLVITVDTAVAHLAGALGKPVWTMIGSAQHWLWQINRTDTPWYPSMRLFRQRAPNQWTDVITEIAQQLPGSNLS